MANVFICYYFYITLLSDNFFWRA